MDDTATRAIVDLPHDHHASPEPPECVAMRGCFVVTLVDRPADGCSAVVVFQTDRCSQTLSRGPEPLRGLRHQLRVPPRHPRCCPITRHDLTSHWSLGVTATGTQKMLRRRRRLCVVARSALTGDETRSRPQRRAMAGDEIDPDREPVRHPHRQKLAKLAARVASINKPTEEATEQPHGNYCQPAVHHAGS